MISVRVATPEDAPAMKAVIDPIIARGGSTAYETPMEVEYLAGKTRAPGFAHVAVDEGGRVIGFQWIALDAADPGLALIASFVALDAAQGGVGSALFPRTEAMARARGCREIDATIRADNVGGLAYYSRMGFVDHSVARGVPLSDGTPVDRISKRKPLGAAQAV